MTKKIHDFINAIARGESGTSAAKIAGYAPKSAHVTAARLLRKAKVIAEIAKVRDKVVTREVAKTGLSLLDHVTKLAQLCKAAEDAEKFDAAITAEVARGRALGHQAGNYRPNLDDLSEDELEQVKRGELPGRLKLA